MELHPGKRAVPLRLNAPVQFRDRWQGRVAGIEVDEQWKVLNLVVRSGVLRWSTSVKLPFSASPVWLDDRVAFHCTSRQAFAREVPPVAAPARLVSADTPVSLPEARSAGLLVDPGRRLATHIILHGGRGLKNRVSIDHVSFEGKVLHIATGGATLPIYLSDAELVDRIRETLAVDRVLSDEERQTVSTAASGGVVTLSGNVRTKRTREWIQALVDELGEAAEIQMKVVDDMELELAIGHAIERAGIPLTTGVNARSVLGDVTLFGYAPSAGAVEEIVRVVSGIPGARNVTSRIEAAEPAEAAS